MDKQIYGQGHDRIIPDALLAEEISTAVYERLYETDMIPSIAQADAEFEGALICGKKVNWVRRNTVDETIFQDVQGNEAPEVSTIELCSDEAEICGQRRTKLKLSNDQLRELKCNGLDGVYHNTIDKTYEDTLRETWNNSHLAHCIMMACADNTGNCAQGLVDLGSPDKPISLTGDRSATAERLEELYTDLELVLSNQNIMSSDGETALILPSIVASRSRRIFNDLNICCGDDNVRITGNMPKTIMGFDPFKTNRHVLRTRYNGKTIYYIVAMDKYASGFVSEMYDFRWREGDFDWFLVGTEVHGSYVVQPEHIAVACVTFE